MRGEKQLWQSLMYENDLYHCGPRERCIPSSAEQKLSIAEDYTFGAATSCNIEGRFLYGLIKGEPQAREAWTAIAQYNHFLVEHRGYISRQSRWLSAWNRVVTCWGQLTRKPDGGTCILQLEGLPTRGLAN